MKERTIREVAQDFGDEMKLIGEQTVKVNILHIIQTGGEDEWDKIELIKKYLGVDYDEECE
jgi:hypothetical protein